MAIAKSKWTRGYAQTARPQTANNTHVQQFTFDLGTEGALAAGDILELGIIPPYCRVTGAQLVTEGVFTGLTADVGLMTGEVGSDTLPDGSTARASGNELFAAADLTVRLQPLSKPDILLLPAVDYERAIGVKVSGAVAAGAGKRIHLLLHYMQ